MRNAFLIYLTLLFFAAHPLSAQVFPKEGSTLNFRSIGFSLPFEKEPGRYRIEIAAGTYTRKDSFRKNIILVTYALQNRAIITVPAFGKQYTWRATYIADDSSKTKTPFYHFSTGKIPAVDSAVNRLRIIDTALQYKDAYVFIDGTKALYDMKGKPVWYMPETDFNKPEQELRDIKITPQGTITFLVQQNIFEVNYNGTVLWKGPDNDKPRADHSETYHHEFTRLQNGHYMVLGSEEMPWGKPAAKALYGTIQEYNHEGKLVWLWRASQYFKDADFAYRQPFEKEVLDVHQNSFYFDEKNKDIYLSFKNMNRVIKIKYPEGTVTNVYGEIYNTPVTTRGHEMFCGQHSCKVSQDGYLYLFNNNSCYPGNLPQIVMMKQPAAENDTLEKIWTYQCTLSDVRADDEGMQASKDSLLVPPANKASYYGDYQAGGNVIELPDRSVFCSMYGSYSKIFIVSRDKKILWNALPEVWDDAQKKWAKVCNYRASIILTQADLDQLIWNAEKDTTPASQL